VSKNNKAKAVDLPIPESNKSHFLMKYTQSRWN